MRGCSWPIGPLSRRPRSVSGTPTSASLKNMKSGLRACSPSRMSGCKHGIPYSKKEVREWRWDSRLIKRMCWCSTMIGMQTKLKTNKVGAVKICTPKTLLKDSILRNLAKIASLINKSHPLSQMMLRNSQTLQSSLEGLSWQDPKLRTLNSNQEWK